MVIRQLSATETLQRSAELTALFQDAVPHGGAGRGVPPLAGEAAVRYWREVAGEVAVGRKRLLVAFDQHGRLAGSAQLSLEGRASGRPRAEAQKVMVRRLARRGGLGPALLARLELEARQDGHDGLTPPA